MSLEVKLAYQDLASIRALYGEYAEMLGMDLSFQNFEKELAALPGEYALPSGRLYLALWEEQVAGTIALRPFDETRCEMKRLFVRPQFRGHRIGRALAEQVIADARELGYRAMVLDTFPRLENSVAIYQKLGFREIPPYRFNPDPEAMFLRLDLSDQ